MIEFNLTSFEYESASGYYYDGDIVLASRWSNGGSSSGIVYYLDEHEFSRSSYQIGKPFGQYYISGLNNKKSEDLILDGRLHLWREIEL